MRRAAGALAGLGSLDLALLWFRHRVDCEVPLPFPTGLVLLASLVIAFAAGSRPIARPGGSRSQSAVNAAGVLVVAAAVLLPESALVLLCAGISLAESRSRPAVRTVGNFLLHLAAALLASAASSALADVPHGGLHRLGGACLAAGLTMCLVTAVLAGLLSHFVDGVPFRQQVIWQPEHYVRAQAFDLLGSLTAFLLLVSPWALLFVGAPQLLLVGLLLRDAASHSAADSDAKTGLLNHPAFEHRARVELGRAARHEEPVCLLVLDLDHLREVNNAHGHPAGDLAIGAVADVLTRTVRAHDLAARVGGEEFLVLLPATGLNGAVDVAERIRRRLADALLPVRTGVLSVTVSVGVAQREAEESLDSLYDRADQALLVAKGAGRDRVEVAAALAA